MFLLAFTCYTDLFGYSTKICKCLISWWVRTAAKIRSDDWWWKKCLSCYLSSSKLYKWSVALCTQEAK